MPRKPSSPTYQELSEQLDELLAKLQNPDCDVDEAAELYESALKCVAQLEEHLTKARNRVTKVQASFESSRMVA